MALKSTLKRLLRPIAQALTGDSSGGWTPSALGSNVLQDFRGFTYVANTTIDGVPILADASGNTRYGRMEVPCWTGAGTDRIELGTSLPASGNFSLSLVVNNAADGILWGTFDGTGNFIFLAILSGNLRLYSICPGIGSMNLLTAISGGAHRITLDRAGDTFTASFFKLSDGSTGSVSQTIASYVLSTVGMTLAHDPFVGWGSSTNQLSQFSFTAEGVTKTYPLQDGPGTSNTNRNIAWYGSNGTGGVISNAVLGGSVASQWSNRTTYVNDACIQNGGGTSVNGGFVVGVPGTSLDAGGFTKTFQPREHRNPYSLFVPNAFNNAALNAIGSTTSDKYSPSQMAGVTSETTSDTRFANNSKYFAVATALSGDEKTKALVYTATIAIAEIVRYLVEFEGLLITIDDILVTL